MKTFPDAIAFVNNVADLAEGAGHHPDIDIRYNRVRLALVTHDAGGLTSKDFDLAAARRTRSAQSSRCKSLPSCRRRPPGISKMWILVHFLGLTSF